MRLPIAVTIAVTCALTLFVSSIASAQSSTDPADVPIAADRGLRIPLMAWTAGVAADQITTYQFSSQYPDLLHERNPLVRGLDRHPVLLVAAGAAIDSATGWATYRFVANRHPRLAKVMFYAAAAYRVYLAAYNIEMMRRADQLRAMTAPHAGLTP